MRGSAFIAAIALCGILLGGADTKPPELVGNLGAPEKISFIGQKTFSESQLREAIGTELSLIVASHPQAKFNEYLGELQKQLESGFKNEGFPDPVVHAIYDEARSRIVVTINEGARFRCGKVQIEGSSKIPPERIREYLTTGRYSKARKFSIANGDLQLLDESPQNLEGKASSLWKAGEPASFSEPSKKWLARGIDSVFQQHGYYHHDVALDIRPESDGTATLTLRVRNQGPRATISQIKVIGNQKNANEDILEFLNLSEGVPVDLKIADEIRNKLRASARFLKQTVEVTPVKDQPGSCDLKITLIEFNQAPTLKQDLTPVQLAALKAGEWIERLTNSDDDVVAEAEWVLDAAPDGVVQVKTQRWNPFSNRRTAKSGQAHLNSMPNAPDRTCWARLAFRPTRGDFILQFQIRQERGNVLFDGTMTVNDKLLILDSAASKVRCELPIFKTRFIGQVECVGGRPSKEGRSFKLLFGMGVVDESSPKRSIKMTCDPVAAVGNLEGQDEYVRIDENQLIFENQIVRCVFDAESGRLRHFQGTLDNQIKVQFKVEVAPRIADAIFREHQQSTANWQTMRLDESPFSCLISFLAGNNGQMTRYKGEQSKLRLLTMARRWQKQEQENPVFLRRGPNSDDADEEQTFRIPFEYSPTDTTKLLYEYGFLVAGNVIPRDSTAWVILREFAFISMGHSDHTSAELISIWKKSECGPFGYLLGAVLFHFVNPNLGSEFAKRGLRKLSLKDFQLDYKPLLTDQFAGGRLLLSLGALLQNCNEQEIDELVSLVALEDGSFRDVAIGSLMQFPKHRGQPSIEVIPLALNELWEPFLKPCAEGMLIAARDQGSGKSPPRTGKK